MSRMRPKPGGQLKCSSVRTAIVGCGPVWCAGITVWAPGQQPSRGRPGSPELQVWFTEALEPALSTIEVLDRAGTRMDRGDVRVDPDDHTQLRVTLLPLPPGQYRVIWRVVSIDTHFRSGSFPFRVDP